MRAAPDLERAVAASAAAPRPAAASGRAEGPAPSRRPVARLGTAWLSHAAWAIDRTGRPGLVGVGLLLAAGVFLLSTHLPVVAEVEALRAELAATQSRARRPEPDQVAAPASPLRPLPARIDMPALLRQLFGLARDAGLAVDTGKYDLKAVRGSSLVRHQVAFPVTGPYPQIRAFLDATLATMPAVALSDLSLERKSIADGNVEAQVRMTIYTAATGPSSLPEAGTAAAGSKPRGWPAAREAGPAADRVVAPTHAAALFAPHSWAVARPPRPPPPPAPPPPQPPPPEPTAPPLPYAFVGSLASAAGPPVFFLARGDRVIDAHVGDRLDGVYQLESAGGGQLVFVYLPLNVRQNLPAGASR